MLQNREVTALYNDLEKFLTSKDFWEDIKKVLETRHPKYLERLEARKNDLERSDHAIVVAGMFASF